jgi:hypothetical protein
MRAKIELQIVKDYNVGIPIEIMFQAYKPQTPKNS